MRAFGKLREKIRRGGALLLCAATLAAGCPMRANSTENDTLHESETAKVTVADNEPFCDSAGNTYPRAPSGVCVIYWTHKGIQEYKNFSDNGSYYRFWVGEGDKKTIAYCIERGVPLETGDEHTAHGTGCDYFSKALPESAQEGIKMAALYGWQGNSNVLIDDVTADDWQLATQIIIWEYQQLIRVSPTARQNNVQTKVENPLTINADLYYNQIKGRSAEKAYNEILRRIEKHKTLLSFSGNSDPYAMKWNTANNRYEVTLTDANSTGLDWVITDTESPVHVVRNGDSFTFYTTEKLESPVELTCRKQVPVVSSALVWECANKQTLLTGSVEADAVTCKLKLHTTDEGTMKIKKTSDDGNVGGVQFTITGNGVNQTVTTETDGTISIALNEGVYTVTETAASKYVQPKAQTIEVKKGETAEANFSNVSKKFRLRVTKQDSQTTTPQGGATLAGAKYGLYRDGELEEECTTDASGSFTTGEYLCGGKWILQEISPSKGYQLDATVYEIDTDVTKLTEAVTTITLTVNEDVILGQISILKLAEDPDPDWYGTPTESEVSSSIESEPESEVSSAVESDAESEVSSTVESEPESEVSSAVESEPESEVSSTTETIAEVFESGEVQKSAAGESSTITEDPESKVESTTSVSSQPSEPATPTTAASQTPPLITRPESGAEFQIYLKSAGSYNDAADNVRDYLKTDKNGTATSKKLPYGEYIVHQATGESGKKFADDFTVFIDESNKIYEYQLTDAALSSKIKVMKIDSESGLAITAAGMRFQITSQYSNTPIPLGGQTEFITDNTGTALLPRELPAGDYRLIEIAAPNGYVLSSVPVDFTVSGKDTEVTLTVANTAQRGQIKLTKSGSALQSVAETDGSFQLIWGDGKLSGAVYRVIADEDITTGDGVVHAEKDTVVDTLTTDENGEAVSTTLYLGKYRLEEVTPPIGYALQNEAVTVELTYAGQLIEVTETAVNLTDCRQNANILLEKSFSGGDGKEVYQSVRFGLFTAEEFTAADGTKLPSGVLVAECGLTEQNGGYFGSFNLDLPFGKYFVKELATHESYKRNRTQFPITVCGDADGGESVFVWVNNGDEIVNEKRPPKETISGSVKLYKTDAESGAPLTGAVFELYADNNQNARLDSADTLLGTLMELENGLHSFADLPEGGYFVKERTAPLGYQRDEAAYYFGINENEREITVTNDGTSFSNEPEPPLVIINDELGALRIRKTAEGGSADGFEIEVKGDNGYCKVFVTPLDGVISVTNLVPGSYTVTELETERSRAYQIPAAVTVTVTVGETAEVSLHNALLPTTVPQTGDSGRILLWAGVSLCALCGIAANAILRKKNGCRR